MSKQIHTIAITGGPCAGKTTAINYLQRKLEDFGFTVIVVSEVATELINSGLTPKRIQRIDFQRELLDHMIEKENRWKRLAASMDTDKVVILCDRGAVEIAAYTSQEEYDEVLRDSGHNVTGIRDGRYDAVIFLNSVAVDAPSFYTCENNTARTESLEEARQLNARTLEVWVGHPHLRVIDNSTDLQGKLKRILQAVCRSIGIPDPLEIERKFLVSGNNIVANLPKPVQSVEIIQHYLRNTSRAKERVRARGQNGDFIYFHTIKQDIRSGVRTEIERRIGIEEYTELLRRADTRLGVIRKVRYCFLWKNQYFELDVFENPNNLTLLEIELAEEGAKVILPDFMNLVEVTNDPRFSNYQMARRLGQKF